MDAIRDPLNEEIVVMKGSQVGWTEAINNCVGFHVHQDPAPLLILQPTLDMAEAWSKDRLAPMVRDTPVLREKIADPKSRDSGNTLLHKRFAGGHLTIVGANAPAGLASRPIRVLLCDEVDRYPASAGTEGDPIDLARQRTSNFRNRKILMGSTPTIKGSSRIESAFEESDQRYYFVPCPDCGEFQRLAWEQVRWPEGKPEEALYFCVHCGSGLQESKKLQMVLHGEWRATRQSSGIAGFHISKLYSLWVPWVKMVKEFLRAKRLPETLQTWINTALGETWEDKGETVGAEGLAKRRESYVANAIPAGVELITLGTDVQDDRLEVFVYGWGRDEEAWRIEHVVLRGDPTQPQIWAEHDQILQRRYATDDGRKLPIEAACIDSGGHCTEAVYQYAVKRKRHCVFAIKGVGGQGRLVWPRRPTRVSRNRADLWIIGVDTIKDVIYGRLKKVDSPGPGYFHFDSGADDAFFAQLASETVVFRTIQGRKIRQWKPKSSGIRQEGLDGTVYAYAAMVARGGSQLLTTRSAHRARPEEPAPDLGPQPETNDAAEELLPPEPPKQGKQPFTRPRRGWMNRRRW